MNLKRYNSPTVRPHPLFNPNIYEQNPTLTDAERLWVQNALAQRRRNMIWGLVADYTFIFFYSVVFAGVIACLIYLALLIYADQQHLFAISGIGAFILFVTAIAIWAIRKIIWRNRQARKIAWSCLTQASQTAAPSDKAIILNASYTLASNLEPDCRMDICDDYEAEDVPLQLPGQWAAQMETNDLAYIPTRVFPVTGSGKVAIFSPQIRGYDTGTVWRRVHRNAIHLQDAGYIMLSIGNFSMHDEMSAGIPPPELQCLHQERLYVDSRRRGRRAFPMPRSCV